MKRNYNKDELEKYLFRAILMLHDELPDFESIMDELGIDADVLEYLGLEPLIEDKE